MAEMPMPEFPMPVAVTRHLKRLSHFCTFAQAKGRFALLHLGQHVVLSLPMAQRRCIDQLRPGFT